MAPFERHLIRSVDTLAAPQHYEAALRLGGGWHRGDVAAPVVLPDGRVLYLCGDTWRCQGGAMPKNSIVEQTDRQFVWLTGPDSSTAVPMDAPAWAWWQGGAVIGDRVDLLGLRMERAPGTAWGFIATDSIVSTLTYPDLEPVGTVPSGAPAFGNWDAGVAYDGEWLYVTGFTRDTWRHMVARTQDVRAPWEVWTGTGWSTDHSQVKALRIERMPLGAVWVERVADRWLASNYILGGSTTDVMAWEAAEITGPYRSLGVAASTVRAGWFCYAGRVTRLPEVGVVVMWSVNAAAGTVYDQAIYGPHFTAAPASLRPPLG